jgi:hypothetical protein
MIPTLGIPRAALSNVTQHRVLGHLIDHQKLSLASKEVFGIQQLIKVPHGFL